MRGLYAIVDTTFLATRTTDPIAFARAVLEARPAALQLRAKDLAAPATLALLRALRPMCEDTQTILVANDRTDLASLAGCRAVHLGQSDLAAARASGIPPDLAFGISTHEPGELARALAESPLYVAYGPIHETRSKVDAEPVVGIAGLAEASLMARAAGVPLVAIGGITLANVRQVAVYADACAVIADLYPPGATLEEVAMRASAFHAAMGGLSSHVGVGA